MARANKTENTNVKPPSAAPTAATTATDPAVDPAQTEDADPSLSQLGDDSTQPPAATATAPAKADAPSNAPVVDPEEADKFLPKPPAELPGLNDGLKGASALNDPPPAAPPADSPANLAATVVEKDCKTCHPQELDHAELPLEHAEAIARAAAAREFFRTREDKIADIEERTRALRRERDGLDTESTLQERAMNQALERIRILEIEIKRRQDKAAEEH